METCQTCGRTEAEPPLTWTVQVDGPTGQQWLCDACTREHLRSIEARLDEAWW